VVTTLAFLLLAPAAGADDPMLEAWVGTNDKWDYGFVSALSLGRGPDPALVVTETVTNHTD